MYRLLFRLKAALRYGIGFPGLGCRDVLLVSYPRSGSTWVRFILCNYIGIKEASFGIVDFQKLDSIMPAIGASNLCKPWQYNSIPRFVKTHHRHSFLYGRPEQVVYVVRDPRDVMVSYYHFLTRHRWLGLDLSFSEFVRHKRWGLASWFQHVQSWRYQASVVLKYERLRKSPLDELLQMFVCLKVAVDHSVLQQAIDLASIETVQAIQQKRGISGPRRFDKSFRFAREGHTRQWSAFFSKHDLTYYSDLCDKYGYRYGENADSVW
jgi:estrone sulfotransferase